MPLENGLLVVYFDEMFKERYLTDGVSCGEFVQKAFYAELLDNRHETAADRLKPPIVKLITGKSRPRPVAHNPAAADTPTLWRRS